MSDPSDGSLTESEDVIDADAAELTASLDKAEERLWKRHRTIWWATLVGPILITVAMVASIYLVSGPEFTGRLLTTALTGMFLFGRFIILAGHDPEVAKITGNLSSLQLFVMVTYLDLIVAVTLMFHTGFLFRLPWFGSRAAAFVNDGRFLIRSQPWIRRTTFFGLVLFVAIPLAAMGSLGGTILGRMLGVTRPRIFLAILFGSLLGNGIMWLGSDMINRFVDKNHPVVRFGGIVLILCLIGLIEFLYRHVKRSGSIPSDSPGSPDR
ncbi:MAG: small multi-drug export protein [Planctomycetota bacterium]|jgi:uncharacterized membrane protein